VDHTEQFCTIYKIWLRKCAVTEHIYIKFNIEVIAKIHL